ncbi:MAG: hypothetical protein JSU86_16495 [Phycisphaerales bacterium]|nr:MAG: hypothetical protein JSU86_16495 [Phycisphaerales bacterium]
MPAGEPIEVVEVGPTGLVITDVWEGSMTHMAIRLYEDEILEYELWHGYDNLLHYHAMTSGVVFAPGTTLRVKHTDQSNKQIGLAGYIPSAVGTIPAVSTVGPLIMVVVVLGAGAIVLARRGQPSTA